MIPCPIHSAAIAALAVVLVVVVIAVLAARRNTEPHPPHHFFEWILNNKSTLGAITHVAVEYTDAGTQPIYHARDTSGTSIPFIRSAAGGSYTPLSDLLPLEAMAAALANKGAASLWLTKNGYEPAADSAGAPTGKLYLVSAERKLVTAAELQDDIAKGWAALTATAAPA